ncbi:MAG: VPLPA-CTERM sorting domain-containing protein [Jhaorihella sp.]
MATPVNGTGNVTPDVIFGSGNANGSFTGTNTNGVELGVRGKLRYNLSGLPENTFNYDGDHTYTFSPAASNPPAGKSAFNFEWSINVDSLGSSGRVLSDLTYLLEIDYDPTAGTNFTSVFDPIHVPYADHSIGTNATGNGGGAEAVTPLDYMALITGNNVAQNSWNMGWFEPAGFDPQTEGMYTINLSAFDSAGMLASTSIDIVYGAVPATIPLPASLPLLAAALGGIGFAARRRRRG